VPGALCPLNGTARGRSRHTTEFRSLSPFRLEERQTPRRVATTAVASPVHRDALSVATRAVARDHPESAASAQNSHLPTTTL